MFENLLFQDAAKLLTDDFHRKTLPNALLLAGPSGSGKLTAALELARALSCSRNAEWNCDCPSCRSHKALVSPDILLAGPRDCTLEIAAARQAFLSESEKLAARFLFIRSVRKLTLRFSPVLWQDDDKVSKFASLLAQIDEKLEEIDPARALPDAKQLEKLTDDLLSTCQKLESGFLYDSIPVLHIRNASSWARYTQADGKKVFIIENAERMQDSVRNALLKILEEPPDDTVFVLTTSKRSAMMPTILSRVRPYRFSDRTPAQSAEIISRIFHTNAVSSIEVYLNSFLPVDPVEVGRLGGQFLIDSLSGKIPDIKKTETAAGKFEPRILLAAFFNGMFARSESMRYAHNPLSESATFAKVTEMEHEALSKIRDCYARITTYNQSPVAALEILVSELVEIGTTFSFKDIGA